MKWASALSTADDLDTAAAEVIGQVLAQLGDASVELLVTFVSPAHDGGSSEQRLQALPRQLRAAFPDAQIIGCTGQGVAGGGREREEGAALALLAAHLPDVGIEVRHLVSEHLPAPDADAEDWRALVDLEPEHQPAFVLLPDPFSFDAHRLMAGLDRGFARAPVVGGVVSGGEQPGSCALLLGERVLRSGALLVALYGDIRMDTVVAQGCRPVGSPLQITHAERNLIHTLDGEKIVPTLEALFGEMTARDRNLFRRSPMLGIAMDDDKSHLVPGDFLIRNIQGVARPSGALAVAARVRSGQRVQFHVRDATSSALELRELLTLHKRQPGYVAPKGALMFTCLGRGQRFFGEPDHDTRALFDGVGLTPLAGFFGNGEIGPVHGQTFLHAYTSAFALFRPRGWS